MDVRHNTFIRALLSATVMVLLFSCASDDEKMPPVEVELVKRAFELSEEVKDAFLKGDAESLQRLCSKRVYSSISPGMDEFSGWKIDFKMRWVDIDEEGTIQMYIAWERDPGREEKNIDMSGLALFEIKEGPLTVERILRENPFLR